MTRNTPMRAIATLTAAAGVGVSALMLGTAAPALAEPTTDCSDMAMPPAEPDPGAGNPLTRPGQLGGLNQAPQNNGDMPMNCPPIGHG